jgi:N-acetylmuramoyl-L-alanine amidase
MRKINWLVIHTAATRPSMDIGAKEIRRWHKAKGWSDIGYHYVIRRDGRVEKGRPDARVGAHVKWLQP